MNAENDNWGRDPSVQRLRHIFANMEQVEKDMLDRAGVTLFDSRLRHVRDAALSLFENSSALASEKRVPLGETAVIELYAICLGKILSDVGIESSAAVLSDRRTLLEIVEEAAR